MAREIKLKRNVGGNIIPWRFVVDESDIILYEGAAPSSPTGSSDLSSGQALIAQTQEPPLAYPDDPGKQMLVNRGIKFHEDDDGKIIIEHVPQREVSITKFLNDEECPPEIPKCQELKDQMLQEIENNGGESCPGCTKGQIHNKYRGILTKLLDGIPAPDSV